MPYYRGDYVGAGRGGYYRGDPFLGALIGGAARLAAPLVGKAVRWVGRQTVGGALTRAAGTAVAAAATPTIIRSVTGQGPIQIDPFAAMPGGEPLFSIGGRKKYRRMNPLNPKALKRAIRRAEGFEKFARKTVSALRYGPKKFKSATRRG